MFYFINLRSGTTKIGNISVPKPTYICKCIFRTTILFPNHEVHIKMHAITFNPQRRHQRVIVVILSVDLSVALSTSDLSDCLVLNLE